MTESPDNVIHQRLSSASFDINSQPRSLTLGFQALPAQIHSRHAQNQQDRHGGIAVGAMSLVSRLNPGQWSDRSEGVGPRYVCYKRTEGATAAWLVRGEEN